MSLELKKAVQMGLSTYRFFQKNRYFYDTRFLLGYRVDQIFEVWDYKEKAQFNAETEETGLFSKVW